MVNSLILREEETFIGKDFSGSVKYETIYLNEDFDYEVSDVFLDNIFQKKINTMEFTNIFIPLCFGPIMSDFNGLRLATHIRCTSGGNRNKNIYIFSFVEIGLLINHECFGILKTKGVKLIDYNFEKINSIVNNTEIALELNELTNEVKKIRLQIPDNYEDSHSVTNEWGIYRWSENIEFKDTIVEEVINNQNSHLYFKYLKTIFPIDQIEKIELEKLKINYNTEPKVLYIDDEANKGWASILKNILWDRNNIYFDYLGEELREKSKNQILDISMSKIKNDNIDVVILDFRLHKDDFQNILIEEIAGYQILKEIKEYNKGIQVIMFSASNKIWNLQALKDVDGFIVKESPKNSFDNLFTKKSIEGLIHNLEESFNLLFVKNIIKKYIKIINTIQGNGILESLVKSYFNISINLLLQTNYDNKFFTFAYLQFFQIIEGVVSFEENFIDGDDASVLVNGKEIVVQKKTGNYIEWPIKFITSNGKYELTYNKVLVGKYIKKIDTNFKVSSLLIFKFGYPNSSVLNWTKIYTKRNNIVAHYNSSQEIKKEDILEIVNFLDYFLDARNINEQNIVHGLKKKTNEESIKALIDSGNFKISKLK